MALLANTPVSPLERAIHNIETEVLQGHCLCHGFPLGKLIDSIDNPKTFFTMDAMKDPLFRNSSIRWRNEWGQRLAELDLLLTQRYPHHPGTQALKQILYLPGNISQAFSVYSGTVAEVKEICIQNNKLEILRQAIGSAAFLAGTHPTEWEIARLATIQAEQGAVAVVSAQVERKCMSLVFVEALALLPTFCLLIAPIGFAVWNYSQRDDTVQSKMQLGLEIATNFLRPMAAISMGLWGEKLIKGISQSALS